MKRYSTHSLGTVSTLRGDPGQIIARPTISKLKDKILCGDALATVSTIPDSCIQSIITSPPYFQQRDYGTGHCQIGGEESPEEYIQKLVDVFRECRRVLKPDGLLWLNLGDKFLAGGLLGLPWRVAIALQQAGWILRCDVIWHKPNAMPHSVKTRPTVDHEYVFMFSKSNDYYYNAEAIREPHRHLFREYPHEGGRNHFGKRNSTPGSGQEWRQFKFARRALGPGISPLGPEQANCLEYSLGKVSRRAFCCLSRKTCRDLCFGEFKTTRCRFGGPVCRQWNGRTGIREVQAFIRADRTQFGILPL